MEGRLLLCYGVEPTDLPSFYDRHGEKISIAHTLDGKKGVLIITRPTKLHGGVYNLARKAFKSSHVRGYPTIHNDHNMQGQKDLPEGTQGGDYKPRDPTTP